MTDELELGVLEELIGELGFPELAIELSPELVPDDPELVPDDPELAPDDPLLAPEDAETPELAPEEDDGQQLIAPHSLQDNSPH